MSSPWRRRGEWLEWSAWLVGAGFAALLVIAAHEEWRRGGPGGRNGAAVLDTAGPLQLAAHQPRPEIRPPPLPVRAPRRVTPAP